jgi:hypothetical protein
MAVGHCWGGRLFGQQYFLIDVGAGIPDRHAFRGNRLEHKMLFDTIADFDHHHIFVLAEHGDIPVLHSDLARPKKSEVPILRQLHHGRLLEQCLFRSRTGRRDLH